MTEKQLQAKSLFDSLNLNNDPVGGIELAYYLLTGSRFGLMSRLILSPEFDPEVFVGLKDIEDLLRAILGRLGRPPEL